MEELSVPVTTVATRASLCSAARGNLQVTRTRRYLGNREFCVAEHGTVCHWTFGLHQQWLYFQKSALNCHYYA